MSSKKIIIATTSILGLFVASAVVLAQESQKPFPEWAKKPAVAEVYQNPKDSVKYLYPDNSKKNPATFVKKENAVKGKLRSGLKINNQRLVKYAQFLAEKKAGNGDIIENLQIDPNRQVYITTIDAPNGLEIPKKDGQNLKYRKSTITIVTDAETGEQFDTVIQENRI